MYTVDLSDILAVTNGFSGDDLLSTASLTVLIPIVAEYAFSCYTSTSRRYSTVDPTLQSWSLRTWSNSPSLGSTPLRAPLWIPSAVPDCRS